MSNNNPEERVLVFQDYLEMHHFFIKKSKEIPQIQIPNQLMAKVNNESYPKSFLMDKTEVTNSSFQSFIAQTGYQTTAECYVQLVNNGDTLNFMPGSLVFNAKIYGWWEYQENINWSKLYNYEVEMDKPVSHISWYDAQAFCTCQGKRLPSEEEWLAAFGGVKRDYLDSNESNFGNVWQGVFPVNNLQIDGYEFAAPVKQFPANENGLYDMQGNVWEWTSTNFSRQDGLEYVLKGGSYLCDQTYCSGYNSETKMNASPDSSFEHVGFRCIKDIIATDE